MIRKMKPEFGLLTSKLGGYAPEWLANLFAILEVAVGATLRCKITTLLQPPQRCASVDAYC